MIKKCLMLYFFISVGLFVSSIVITGCKKAKESYFLSVKETYSVTYDDKALIEVPLYFTDFNKFSDLSNISSVSLISQNMKINCDLENIVDVGKRKYEDTYLNTYVYEIYIPCDNTILMKNAMLEINCQNESILAEIGSVSIRHVNDLGQSKELTINSSSVLAKSGTIEAFSVTLEAKEELIIKNILVDNTSVFVDLNNVIEINKEYDENDSVSDVISGYNIYSKQANFEFEEICLNSEIKLLLPLKYIDNVMLQKAPVIIEYEINGISDEYVLDDFKYVNHLYEIIDLGGIVKCPL